LGVCSFGVIVVAATYWNTVGNFLSGAGLPILGISVLAMWGFALTASIRALRTTIGCWSGLGRGFRVFGIVQCLVVASPIILTFYAAASVMSGAGHKASPRRYCEGNLKQIEGAKAAWGTEHSKTTNDIPTDADLFGEESYIRERLRCPSGGTYVLGRVGEKPSCSFPGHGL
jgi:hypothetical protein